METLTFKKDSWTAWVFLVVTLISVSILFTGCGKDKKKGAAVATAPDRNGHPACASCGSYTDELQTAANASMDDAVDFALALYSPVVNTNSAYSGPVDLGGYMEVLSTPITECPFTTGYWRLRVVQPNGTYASNLSSVWNLTNLSLEAVHDDGRVAQLYIPYMEFYDAQAVQGTDGYSYQNTFRGEVYVSSVDGYACGWPGTPRKIFFILK
ncbi:MAG: hypothetical protein KDD34_00350 [Bdellovibrionales bacterium]|nr:hypothetical protein [Bdellovibrionales bacterium]